MVGSRVEWRCRPGRAGRRPERPPTGLCTAPLSLLTAAGEGREQRHTAGGGDRRRERLPEGSSWLNPRQRQAVERYQKQLRSEKYARSRTFTLDFAGRDVSTQRVEVTVDPTHINALIQELASADLSRAPPPAPDETAAAPPPSDPSTRWTRVGRPTWTSCSASVPPRS